MFKRQVNWENDTVTESQLKFIQRIMDEAAFPLEPFRGRTRREAAKWIQENKIRAHRSIEFNSEN